MPPAARKYFSMLVTDGCPQPRVRHANTLLVSASKCLIFSKHGCGTGVADIVGMNASHQELLEHEVRVAERLMDRGNLDDAVVHLERAHVLGQTQAGWHVLAHFLMLKVAIRRRQGIVVAAQAVRIILGAIGSVVGRVPTGNTGGSDVSMFAPMPIAPELLRVMGGANLDRRAVGDSDERAKSWNT